MLKCLLMNLIVNWALLFASLAFADEFSHRYEVNEAVTVWFGKVVSWRNPEITHSFTWLPLCSGQSSSPEPAHSLSLVETIEGLTIQDSRIEALFLQESNQRPLCSVQLTAEDLSLLREAVRKQFWLQMFVDDLPVWGPLGKIGSAKESESVFVYTHFNLQVSHNANQIIQVLYHTENPVKLGSEGQSLDFSYSITWRWTSTPFEDRLGLYTDPGFFLSSKHVGMLVSFVLLAIAFALVVRLILGKLIIYQELVECAPPVINTSGTTDTDLAAFKQMAGEVFRVPSCLLLFTVCVSAGTQLLAVALSMLLLFLVYPVYIERTHVTSILAVLYSLFSLLGGFRSGSFYIQQSGRYWITALVVSALGVPLLVVLNLQEFSPVWLSTVEGRFLLFVGAPLHVVGTFLGRKYLANPQYPCKISTAQPPTRYQKCWYQQPFALILIAGILPYVATRLLVYTLSSNLWEVKLYCIYGFGLAAFLLLLISTAGTAVAVTYKLVTLEDYRWPWVSFLSAGSTAGYLFLAALYFYWKNFPTREGMRWDFYFGCMGIGCFGLFLIFGAVGHFAASLFLRYVYTYLKRL